MSTNERSATAIAHANIAFVKYWGNLVPALRLPYNDSLSMNLSAAHTRTEVRFEPGLAQDRLTIDGKPAERAALDRVSLHLDLIRGLAGFETRARVQSKNSFPMGTGIASSAAAFAALSVAGAAAAGLDLSERALSALARRGSGSASRSVPGGFAVWYASAEDAGSYSETLVPADHWDLRDVVAVVSRKHKRLGSTDGHGAAALSPFFRSRIERVPQDFERIKKALLDRDMTTFGPAVEAEALALHAIAMTGVPSAIYLAPETISLIDALHEWRREGLPVWFTLDAGPNLHLICEGEVADALLERLRTRSEVESILHNRAAGPAHLVADFESDLPGDPS